MTPLQIPGTHSEVIAALPVAVYTTDASGVIHSFNQAAEELWGRRPERGARWCGALRLYTLEGEPLPPDRSPLARLVAGKEPLDREVILERPDGSRRNVIVHPALLRDDAGVPTGAIVTLLDVTTDRTTRDALAAKDAELRLVIATTPLFLIRCSRDLKYLFINRAAADLFRKSPEDLIGRSIPDVMGQKAFSIVKPYIDQVLDGNRVEFETQVPYPAGVRWVSVTYLPERDASGAVTGWLASIVDVTRRRFAEDTLQQREQYLRAVIEMSPECITVIAPDGLIEYMSPSGLAMVDADSLAEVNRRNMYDLIAPQDRNRFREFHERVCAGAKESLEFDLVGLKGTRRGMLTDAVPLQDLTGRWNHLSVMRDMTERQRAESTRAYLAAIVQSTDDAVVSKTLDGIITSWNAGAQRIFGYTPEEAVGNHIDLIIPPELRPEERQILQKLRAGQRIDHFDTERLTKDGCRVHLSLTISPVRDSSGRIIGASKVARDITDRKRTELELARHQAELEQRVQERTRELSETYQKLRVSERMAMMGTLSAGLGHDMGNLLVPLRLRLESLASQMDSPQAKEDLEAIQTSVEYLRRLTNGLRLVAVDPSQSAPDAITDLTGWWADAQGVLRSVLPPRILISGEFPPGLIVRMSRPALTQAVFNLVQNSGDAMKSRGEGTIRISARSCEGQVLLSISDDGPGMTPETRARCMEPYFTTKTRGISTGLGLTLVYGLVRDAGGHVELTSELGLGTTFTLLLPAGAVPAQVQTHTPRVALVKIRDARLRSFLATELKSLHFQSAAEPEPGISLAVIDEPALLVKVPAGVPVVFLGEHEATSANGTVRAIGAKPGIWAIREAINQATKSAPVTSAAR